MSITKSNISKNFQDELEIGQPGPSHVDQEKAQPVQEKGKPRIASVELMKIPILIPSKQDKPGPKSRKRGPAVTVATAAMDASEIEADAEEYQSGGPYSPPRVRYRQDPTTWLNNRSEKWATVKTGRLQGGS